MNCPDNPGELMKHVGDLLTEKIQLTVRELRASDYFEHRPENFNAGIRDATGGHAGDLAALFSPDVANENADILLQAAKRWKGEMDTSYPNGKCCARPPGSCEGHPVRYHHSGGCLAEAYPQDTADDPCVCFELEIRLAHAMHRPLCPHAPAWPGQESSRA